MYLKVIPEKPFLCAVNVAGSHFLIAESVFYR
jgi:hypothetical protein